MIRHLARVLVYPLVVFSSVGLIVHEVGAGVSYWRVGPPVVLGVSLIVMALERWLPHAASWQHDLGDTRTDRLHFAGNILLNQASVGGYAAVAAVTHGGLGWWPAPWSFSGQFVLALLVLDLSLYAVHRASHVVTPLWRLHAIHHSARRLYWLNGQRRHLLHEVLEGAPGLVTLGALGAPVSVVACSLAAVTIHLMFQHGNIDYRGGPLRHVFSVAELHRWHHQRLYADVQGNYGAILAVWDHLFGTALRKAGAAPLDVGMDDEPDLPDDYLGQLAWPFRRRFTGREGKAP